MTTIFFICLFIIFYAFIGYGMLLFVLVKLKRLFKGKPTKPNASNLPTCTLIVAAYNEEDFIEEKIKNTLALNYPANKLKVIFITDGSTDKTPDIIADYLQIQLMHQAQRLGKMAAIHRAVASVDTEVIVFTDANTFLNTDALTNICRHYSNEKVGAVAGEKRVSVKETADATAGEGFYWKYESKLKTWDSELHSVVGAAGELFSVRTALYQYISTNAIIDDFMISMLIAKDGYKIVYEPEAYATETTSLNVKEELKRKIRIAAGGIQSIIWLRSLLLPFKTPLLSFQYISHRVLRWTIVPILMMVSLFMNMFIVTKGSVSKIFLILLLSQIMFYLMAFVGWIMESKRIKLKLFFIPYYFSMMNYAVLRGIFRFVVGNQTGIWEKAKRA